MYRYYSVILRSVLTTVVFRPRCYITRFPNMQCNCVDKCNIRYNYLYKCNMRCDCVDKCNMRYNYLYKCNMRYNYDDKSVYK